MCDSSDKTPIWKAIANALRSDLAEGHYSPGEKLPTEAALAARFGVNRHTVRHGLSALVSEGLVRTRRGAGAFVVSTPADYRLGHRVRFHENLIDAGRHPEKRVLSLDTRAATQREARALHIQVGDQVCAYHGLLLADGQPLAVFLSVFPSLRLSGIFEALSATTSVTQALRSVGIDDYTRASTRLTAVRSTATQALLLQAVEGDPLLRSSSVNQCANAIPVEYGRTWFVGDRITLTLGET